MVEIDRLMARVELIVAQREAFLLPQLDRQAVRAVGGTLPPSSWTLGNCAASRLFQADNSCVSASPWACAASLRSALQDTLGSDLSALRPGSEAAQRLKQQLQQRGAWRQTLCQRVPVWAVSCRDFILAAGELLAAAPYALIRAGGEPHAV